MGRGFGDWTFWDWWLGIWYLLVSGLAHVRHRVFGLWGMGARNTDWGLLQ